MRKLLLEPRSVRSLSVLPPVVLGRRGRVRRAELLLRAGLHQLPRRLRVLLLGRIQTQLGRLQLRRHVKPFTPLCYLKSMTNIQSRQQRSVSFPSPPPPSSLSDSLCVDVDECLAANGGCDHTCQNNAGSFQCFCRRGFRLDEDRQSCIRELAD